MSDTTPTPRTDARAHDMECYGCVSADFARELERELSEYKATNQQLYRETNQLRAQLDDAQQCLAFFASVIKSGEPWTESCQQAYDATKKGTV